ncbi:trifunctional serine/threonine-protein kinase/ATP-binding protein/sensor histidine kinase [Paraburkholderia humisilvae]|uniref:histidine kinase n=1 Tax=Paraburkholderia humisilvae TaxID=627669 RepID=A0A6J5EPM3_9BURK|nr:ATP-binding sensor histidine kinase [Paraburkholderia humisilvae]CAB3768518.1 Adaptive-response sensory-kinase SasA [Paraburkholderia humisilvae]
MVDSSFEVLANDGDRAFCRMTRTNPDGTQTSVLTVRPTGEPPTAASLDRVSHEYGLKDQLHSAWAVRPLELVRQGDQTVMVCEDPGGEPLGRLLGAPFDTARFLSLAIRMTAAVGELHQSGLVHKDLKPAHILVDEAAGSVRLTGFGLATLLPRERQAPASPETIAGTLAYMAPEQTGRMNRSIDARSDLYSLGVTFYQMLTGALPFTASEPMEWVHCHIARKPVPPDERIERVPSQVSRIVMKLLAKTVEERYQTAAGLQYDLRRALAGWRSQRRIDPFALGEHDIPDRLLIPEKLYGREHEIATLLDAFERVVHDRTPRLVLVSGYSGVGKSSVVNELHKVLVPPRGLFAWGKFDQYKRNVPYATVAQAFQCLVSEILGKSDEELGRWRAALQEALGPNGQLMVNLVPQLALIIGEPPPPPDVPLQDQQARFQMVFRRFLSVFARPEHPLTLFLDDLQWLDSATLDLIEHLIAHPDVRHLLLVGAYRDNEVGPAHPLARTLARLRGVGGRVDEIVLAPLGLDDVGRLLADALHLDAARVRPLAELVFEKTGGNPFFTIQFLLALADQALLAFDTDAVAWAWDLPRIRMVGFTDNVADLMAAKLGRLPRDTQQALGRLACLGNIARAETLAVVYGAAEETTHAALWDAVRSGLVVRANGTYTFLHDRIHEAAYALIPEGARAGAHLRIGRALAAATPTDELGDNIFDIVNQFDLGAALIGTQPEREQVARLNLMAGQRAKAASAYDAALRYCRAGRALLAQNEWEQGYRLKFDLELNAAECEYLIGEMAAASAHLAMLSTAAQTLIDLAAVTCIRINLFTTLDQSDSAVEVGLEYLRKTGGEWSPHPAADVVLDTYQRLWRRLRASSSDALLDLPLMKDPERRATMDVLTVLTSPALFSDPNLFRLVVSEMASLSLEHGNSDGSSLAYTWLGGVLGSYLGEYAAGFRYGRLGLELVEKRGLDRFRARVYLVFAVHISHWMEPLQVSRTFLRRAFEAALEAGDLSYACYACGDVTTNRIAAGDALADIEREALHGLEFARKVRFGLMNDILTGQLLLTRTLRGPAASEAADFNAAFDARSFEQRLEDTPQLAVAASYYWIRKLQASIHFGDEAGAIAAVAKAVPLLWTTPTQFECAEFHFYAALARAAHCDSVTSVERSRYRQALDEHHEQLAVWASNCPVNFADRVALVGAEIARVDRRDMEALRLYEEAIRLAREGGFIHNEALANERAARFCTTRGLPTMTEAFLRNARRCYLSWGADSKVRQLDQRYAQLASEASAPGPTSTIRAPVEHLDLATVLRVSQAVSGEIVLDKLIDTLMRTAIEHAGAVRGLLILSQSNEQRIAAEAVTVGETITVRRLDEPLHADVLSEAIVQKVLRTQEALILDDALADSVYAADPYIRQRAVRSVLCVPLANQSKTVGVLYLENNLTARAFTPTRITVLHLIASQAAIALENTRLYRDLAEREARIRRIVDANIIGISFWDLEGPIHAANDAFLQIVGYDREDLAAGRLRWTDLTPPEWRVHHDSKWTPELKLTGNVQPYEKEYFRKDGTRVPVLVGSTSFDEARNQGVSFVLDLTESKRAEEALRVMQMELAHVNRVATMGQLTASIAHEVNQPIAATVSNAEAALRWLNRQPPDLKEVREATERIVKEGHRAADVIGRIRALIKKAPPVKDRLNINDAIREVLELVRGEIAKNDVLVWTELAAGLPLIHGDRVQLQQVLLNLIVNAIEAMSGVAGGVRRLSISTWRADDLDGVLVEVRDSGQGLDPEHVDVLFETFYSTKASGMGMGLAICRSIVEAHGGRLWAGANEPRGAVFRFTLPVDGAVA